MDLPPSVDGLLVTLLCVTKFWIHIFMWDSQMSWVWTAWLCPHCRKPGKVSLVSTLWWDGLIKRGIPQHTCWRSREPNIRKEIQESTGEGKVVKSFPEAPLSKKKKKKKVSAWVCVMNKRRIRERIKEWPASQRLRGEGLCAGNRLPSSSSESSVHITCEARVILGVYAHILEIF